MEKLISCAFNMDTAYVELRFTDGSICSIDCTAVENEVADNRFQRAELDYLIYNDPLAYADLVLNGDYLNEGGIFVFEHGKDYDFSEHPRFLEHRSYGSVNFSIFR